MYATYPCRVWFWDRVCIIGEFICDTPIHKGQRALPWQPILGLKLLQIHINAFLREITRLWLLITGGFRGQPIQIRHFCLQGSKGRCHGNQNFRQNKPKYHKNGHNFSCMQHIDAEFGFEIGFVVLGNSFVILPYTRYKGALPRQPILGLKLLSTHINAFLQEITRMITYNRGFSWSTNPMKTFLFARV